MIRFFIFSILCLWPAVVSAQSLPMIETRPEGLQPVETREDLRRFAAVGRLDLGNGFCTATLIAPDLILTAAHCMFDPATGQRRDHSVMRFNAGLRDGDSVAQRGVEVSFVHPDYDRDNQDRGEMIATDLAIARLDRAIETHSILPMHLGGQTEEGGAVTVVSYGRAREGYASLEDGCGVIGEDRGVFALTCSVVSGSSGSPVMVDTPGGYRIASVISATAEWRNEPVALAVALEGSIMTLLRMADNRPPALASAAPSSVPSAQLPQVRSFGQGSQTSREIAGAVFIRP